MPTIALANNNGNSQCTLILKVHIHEILRNAYRYIEHKLRSPRSAAFSTRVSG
jgi:hypothetical protein